MIVPEGLLQASHMCRSLQGPLAAAPASAAAAEGGTDPRRQSGAGPCADEPAAPSTEAGAAAAQPVNTGGHCSSAGSGGGADGGDGQRGGLPGSAAGSSPVSGPHPGPGPSLGLASELPASAPESLAAGSEATEWFDPATPPQSPTARDGCAATERASWLM